MKILVEGTSNVHSAWAEVRDREVQEDESSNQGDGDESEREDDGDDAEAEATGA